MFATCNSNLSWIVMTVLMRFCFAQRDFQSEIKQYSTPRQIWSAKTVLLWLAVWWLRFKNFSQWWSSTIQHCIDDSKFSLGVIIEFSLFCKVALKTKIYELGCEQNLLSLQGKKEEEEKKKKDTQVNFSYRHTKEEKVLFTDPLFV